MPNFSGDDAFEGHMAALREKYTALDEQHTKEIEVGDTKTIAHLGKYRGTNGHHVGFGRHSERERMRLKAANLLWGRN